MHGPERGLKEARIGRGDAAPADGSGIGREQLGVVEALLADAVPACVFDDPGVELVLPQHRDRLTLRIVVDAGGVDQGRLSQPRRLLDRLDQPATLPEVNKLPGLR